MANRFSKEQLEAFGMSPEQISAIMATYEAEDRKTVVQMPVQKVEATKEPERIEKLTDVAALREYAKGTTVRLPDFGPGQPFVARVRRPSMLVLAKQGKIPNTLLSAANALFAKGGDGMDVDNNKMLSDMYDVCRIVCESALVEPTLDEIESAGLSLSDDQLMAIFNYTQAGVKALESFR